MSMYNILYYSREQEPIEYVYVCMREREGESMRIRNWFTYYRCYEDPISIVNKMETKKN